LTNPPQASTLDGLDLPVDEGYVLQMAKTFPQNVSSDEKLRELILYIAHKSKDDPRCGAVKLNKLLYYADFTAYRLLGRSITGAEYQHLQEGPAPRRGLPAQERLKRDGAIEKVYKPSVVGEPMHVIVPKRKPYSIFSKQEKEIVNRIVEEFKGLSGSELSDISHKEFGWRLTKLGETIHYRTAWLSGSPLTEDQVEFGRKVAVRHGLAG
jgi:uncharacterized phage-associated protein